MATILTDISALSFYRTPPVVRSYQLDSKSIDRTASPIFTNRRNASPDLRAIESELFGNLKGVSFPVHLTSTTGARCVSSLVAWHRPTDLRLRDEAIQIGDNLYVASPAQVLLDLAAHVPWPQLARIMCELCGLFASCPQTSRTELALDALVHSGSLPPSNRRYSAYYDVRGNARPLCSPRSVASSPETVNSWSPSTTKGENAGRFWSRAPLCTPDELVDFSKQVHGTYGSNTFMRAARAVVAGSASPLESTVALMLGGSRKLGQEGMGPFQLNRRFELLSEAREALGASSCVLDMCWPDAHGRLLSTCLEINGAAFHGNERDEQDIRRGVYDDSARTNALDLMGMHVCTVTYRQFAQLDRWDTFLETLYKHLGMKRPMQSAAFLRQRVKLHRELMHPAI